MKGITKEQYSRLRWLVVIEAAARATYDVWNAEPDPKIQDEYRRAAGALHAISERLKRRWKVT